MVATSEDSGSAVDAGPCRMPDVSAVGWRGYDSVHAGPAHIRAFGHHESR